MIKLNIIQEQIERARELYPFDSLKGSITEGGSNIYGALGEIMIYDWSKLKTEDVDFNSTYDYDMIIKGRRVDIKTKKTTVVPKPFYLCSISAFNSKQDCDHYIFTRIDESLKVGYILGYISKKRFFKDAAFKKKGELDINGWTFKDDCYNIEVSKLTQFKTLA
ncbi:hypothetical protein N9043_00640 [bacterium]|nr:hypothetical protein [bacterium]